MYWLKTHICTHVSTSKIYIFQVRVVDDQNRRKIVSHSFSLDGSWLSTSIFPKLVLMINIVCIVSLNKSLHLIKFLRNDIYNNLMLYIISYSFNSCSSLHWDCQLSHYASFDLFICVIRVSISKIYAYSIVHNKIYAVCDPDKRIELPRRRMKFFHLWLRKLWILSAVDRVFFGLVLYTLYFAIGKFTRTSGGHRKLLKLI